MKPYEFTEDWTEHRTELWAHVMQGYVGAPARMLEVGSFEGRSAAWFLDNVLTNPDAHIVCVDTFAGSSEHSKLKLDLSGLEQRFDRNMARHEPKVTKVKGDSRLVLRDLPPASFDIAYVDGSHEAADVLLDAVLTWDLVKTGGLVLFDDYGGGAKGLTAALDAFLSCFAGRYEVVHKAYQVVLTKTEEAPPHSRS